MTPERIKDELEALEPIRKALRQRAMIYEAEAKEQLALANGLPIETYYYLSYEDWRQVCRN